MANPSEVLREMNKINKNIPKTQESLKYWTSKMITKVNTRDEMRGTKKAILIGMYKTDSEYRFIVYVDDGNFVVSERIYDMGKVDIVRFGMKYPLLNLDIKTGKREIYNSIMIPDNGLNVYTALRLYQIKGELDGALVLRTNKKNVTMMYMEIEDMEAPINHGEFQNLQYNGDNLDTIAVDIIRNDGEYAYSILSEIKESTALVRDFRSMIKERSKTN